MSLPNRMVVSSSDNNARTDFNECGKSAVTTTASPSRLRSTSNADAGAETPNAAISNA
jgi:hypothetical protein